MPNWTVHRYGPAGRLVPESPPMPKPAALALLARLEEAEADAAKPQSYTARPERERRVAID